MKSLQEMDNRELFCILTGDGDVAQQIMLKNILQEYKEKHPDELEHYDKIDLSAIVAEMTE